MNNFSYIDRYCGLNEFVVILGSGISINSLTHDERTILNSYHTKIAINKYAAFYENSGIVPTHVYFEDDYDESAIKMLSFIVNKIRKNGVKDVTYVISENYRGCLYSNRFVLFFKKASNFLMFLIQYTLVKLFRFFFKKGNKSFYDWVRLRIEELIPYKSISRFNRILPENKINYISKQNWINSDNKWAKTLEEPLYHFRGSFSTVLNYVSVCFPNHPILLVGVDFNTSEYFFQEELKKLKFETSDWTTKITHQNNKHFSLIDYKGTKMDDELPYMISCLKETNNIMYSSSEQSYLVLNGYVPYLKIPTE